MSIRRNKSVVREILYLCQESHSGVSRDFEEIKRTAVKLWTYATTISGYLLALDVHRIGQWPEVLRTLWLQQCAQRSCRNRWQQDMEWGLHVFIEERSKHIWSEGSTAHKVPSRWIELSSYLHDKEFWSPIRPRKIALIANSSFRLWRFGKGS